jgi:hypothetical protein
MCCLIEKLDSSKYISVIRDGNRIHAEELGFIKHLFDPDGAIEKTVFGVDMEMDKR